MSSAEKTVSDGSRVLRAFARAFGRFEDFDRFTAALEGALTGAGGMGRIRLDLDLADVADRERFEGHVLAMPLLDRGTSLGVMLAGDPGERTRFGAADLHLMAGLADFVGATLAQARRAADASRLRELLRILLDQAPVGIAAYDAERRPLVENSLASGWLGGALPPLPEAAGGSASFHFRAAGRLIAGEARPLPGRGAGGWVVVLHDLSPEQGRLLGGMERELYRALAEERPFGVALLEASSAPGILARLPELRAALVPGELAGPYDATRVALGLGAAGPALRARLRGLRSALGDPASVRLGYAELRRDGRSAEDLLKSALARDEAFETTLRPALLVHGESTAVADSLALALGRDFHLARSTTAAEAEERLAAEAFDGIVTELDPWGDAKNATNIVALARTRQPGLAAIYTTIEPVPPRLDEPGAVVISKPFDVAAVRSRLRAAW